MKRFLILGACILLCSSLVARADILSVLTVGDAASNYGLPAGTSLGTVEVTRTASTTAGYDKLVYKLLTFAGPASGGIFIVEGTWTPVNAITRVPIANGIRVSRGYLSTDDGEGTYGVNPPEWGMETRKGTSRDSNTSWINLDGSIGALSVTTHTWPHNPPPGYPVYPTELYPDPDRQTLLGGHYYTQPDPFYQQPSLYSLEAFSRTGTWDPALGFSGNDSDYLKGIWMTMGAAIALGQNLGTFYVTTGADLNFTGLGDIGPGGVICHSGRLGYSGPAEGYNVRFTPEPSTFVLLGMAGLGLLAYAWRRRRS